MLKYHFKAEIPLGYIDFVYFCSSLFISPKLTTKLDSLSHRKEKENKNRGGKPVPLLTPGPVVSTSTSAATNVPRLVPNGPVVAPVINRTRRSKTLNNVQKIVKTW